ncbi:MAG: peptide chain release factor N(5)-glutamine methyltransferase [Bacilli bacterium]|nr:peptide chain release factor N(5)-glutamine methyltransferase [Bacilli bacterium]
MKRPKDISLQDWELLNFKYKNMDSVIKKIKEGYPIQYLIGTVDFFGYPIIVNKNVLIPRFETELLVEKTINYMEKLKIKKSSLLEIATGSGCISIALKKLEPNLEITAIDVSRKALCVAKKNAKLNKVKINYIKKNIFKYNLINKYNILISNPPYLIEGEAINPNTKHEPKIALYADKTGINFYHKILEIAKKTLNKKHLIALEIDEDRAEAIKKIAKSYFPKDIIKLEKDLANKNRFLFIYNE